ncbi:MAG: alpha/beta fold hydrolase [Rhodococcus sp. (in: high G+C Gram-positive bacteria)]
MTRPFVLIPGAGGDPWYWHRVERELSNRGSDVVAVRLPAADPEAGLADYTAAVIDAMGGSTDAVLVAQSLGGFTAPLVAARKSVAMIVLVNAMTPKPGESPGDWWGATDLESARREQARRDGRDLDTEDQFADVFFHDVPAFVTEEALTRGPIDQSDGPFALPWPPDAWPDVPTRFLQGVDDRFFPVELQRRLVEERLGITVDEMPGGHLLALSRPVELADRLESYRSELEAERLPRTE